MFMPYQTPDLEPTAAAKPSGTRRGSTGTSISAAAATIQTLLLMPAWHAAVAGLERLDRGGAVDVALARLGGRSLRPVGVTAIW